MNYYFVSYSHETGFGNCVLSNTTGVFNIKTVKDKINSLGAKQPIILNFQKISKEEYDKFNET